MENVNQNIVGTSLLDGIGLNYICVVGTQVLGEDTSRRVFKMIHWVVLRLCSWVQQQQHCLGTCQKCKFMGPSQGPLHHKLWGRGLAIYVPEVSFTPKSPHSTWTANSDSLVTLSGKQTWTKWTVGKNNNILVRENKTSLKNRSVPKDNILHYW